jgi:hypothetical protein
MKTLLILLTLCCAGCAVDIDEVKRPANDDLLPAYCSNPNGFAIGVAFPYWQFAGQTCWWGKYTSSYELCFMLDQQIDDCGDTPVNAGCTEAGAWVECASKSEAVRACPDSRCF